MLTIAFAQLRDLSGGIQSLEPVTVRDPAKPLYALQGERNDFLSRKGARKLSKSSGPGLPPPRPLDAVAREVWNRHADRIWHEGRWPAVDQELLAVFAETLALYLKFTADVDRYGTLVRGRTDRELVRNPSLMGLGQCRADLVRLARQVPLMAQRIETSDTGDVDAFIADLMGDQ
jgi:phage terminase small subunit